MLTKEQFLADMKKGWETLGYTNGRYWEGEGDFYGYRTRYATGNREDAKCACAIGAAAYAAGLKPLEYVTSIPPVVANAIMNISDTVGNTEPNEDRLKETAIKRITEAVERLWK